MFRYCPFMYLLFGAVGFAMMPPVTAQAQTISTHCQANISLPSGSRLMYKVSGLLPEKKSDAVPLNPIGNDLKLTVQRRDAKGNIQTLLKESSLEDYAQLAPDADYSKLPFSGQFQGQPNHGDRLFSSRASVHGLYVSLRPLIGQPQAMQVVHSLSPGQYLQSMDGTCSNEMAASSPEDQWSNIIEQDLAVLRQKLAANDWAGADQETRRLLAPESVSIPPTSRAVQQAAVLRAIDQAWLNASQGRFGLSVQLKLWQAAQAAHPTDQQAAVDAFRDRVGWKLTSPREFEDFISSEWRNESELDYSMNAPMGHLPWAGVSDAVVQKTAVPPEGVHCGVCNADAMQLRYARFYNYLPLLFKRIQAAVNT